uniref:Uncharacterized protein n=1 Tax=Glossina brevipalpis TaxID=37001 RepID=A0A1A9X513_9MUSC
MQAALTSLSDQLPKKTSNKPTRIFWADDDDDADADADADADGDAKASATAAVVDVDADIRKSCACHLQ